MGIRDTYEEIPEFTVSCAGLESDFHDAVSKYGVSVLDGLLGSCLIGGALRFFYRFVWTGA